MNFISIFPLFIDFFMLKRAQLFSLLMIYVSIYTLISSKMFKCFKFNQLCIYICSTYIFKLKRERNELFSLAQRSKFKYICSTPFTLFTYYRGGKRGVCKPFYPYIFTYVLHIFKLERGGLKEWADFIG